MSFWKDGFSIEESKFSIIVFLLLIFSGLAVYMYIDKGDIPSSLVQMIITFVSGVAGVNIVSSISKSVGEKRENKQIKINNDGVEFNFEEQDIYEKPIQFDENNYIDNNQRPTI